MPIEAKIGDNGRGAIMDCRGTLGDDELIDALHRQFHRPEEFKQLTYLILDFSAVTRMNLEDKTADAIAKLCAAAERVNPHLLVAVVAYFSMTADIDLINRLKGLYKVFQHRSGWEGLVFRTRPEARRWLRKRSDEKFGISDP